MKEPEILHISETGAVAFGSYGGDVYAFSSNTTKNGSVRQAVDTDSITESVKYALWGDDNLWPQRVVNLARKNDLINQCVSWKTRKMYSHGLMYGTLSYENVNGQTIEKLTPVRDLEIEKWLRKTNVNRYLREAGYDRYKFGNAFTQFIMAKDYRSANPTIAGIYAHDATECRLGKQKEKGETRGKIEQCFISAMWEYKSDPGATEKDDLPLLDPYYDVEGQIRNGKEKNYVLPSRSLVDGNKYYEVPNWYSIIESGWYEVAQEIPKLKKATMQQQIRPSYHIEVHPKYWIELEPDWDNKTHKEKQAIMKGAYKLFLKTMAGTDNAGSAIMTGFGINESTGDPYSLWKVTQIKTKVEKGEYLEDSQEADYHMIRAHEIPPVLIGVNGKEGLGAGSGSDQRIAEINWLLSSKMDMDLLLEPFYTVSEINGWNKRYEKQGGLVWWTKKYYAATLDLGDNPKAQDNAN